MMLSKQRGGRIVFVGSFLALTTFVGYAGYSPGKYALKGAQEPVLELSSAV